MRTWVLPLLVGLLTGYNALWLQELGWVIAAAVLISLPIVYLRLQRRAAVGWLFIGAAVAPILILGRTILHMLTDPAGQVYTGTWIFFTIAVILAGAGIFVIVTSGRRQPAAG